jgi:hypothetical protein
LPLQARREGVVAPHIELTPKGEENETEENNGRTSVANIKSLGEEVSKGLKKGSHSYLLAPVDHGERRDLENDCINKRSSITILLLCILFDNTITINQLLLLLTQTAAVGGGLDFVLFGSLSSGESHHSWWFALFEIDYKLENLIRGAESGLVWHDLTLL